VYSISCLSIKYLNWTNTGDIQVSFDLNERSYSAFGMMHFNIIQLLFSSSIRLINMHRFSISSKRSRLSMVQFAPVDVLTTPLNIFPSSSPFFTVLALHFSWLPFSFIFCCSVFLYIQIACWLLYCLYTLCFQKMDNHIWNSTISLDKRTILFTKSNTLKFLHVKQDQKARTTTW